MCTYRYTLSIVICVLELYKNTVWIMHLGPNTELVISR